MSKYPPSQSYQTEIPLLPDDSSANGIQKHFAQARGGVGLSFLSAFLIIAAIVVLAVISTMPHFTHSSTVVVGPMTGVTVEAGVFGMRHCYHAVGSTDEVCEDYDCASHNPLVPNTPLVRPEFMDTACSSVHRSKTFFIVTMVSWGLAALLELVALVCPRCRGCKCFSSVMLLISLIGTGFGAGLLVQFPTVRDNMWSELYLQNGGQYDTFSMLDYSWFISLLAVVVAFVSALASFIRCRAERSCSSNSCSSSSSSDFVYSS